MPNAFLELAPDNVIRFYCPRDEMGQGVTTGLATLIGEELDIAPAALRVEFAAVHPAYRNPVFRVQATGASTSMRAHFQPLRQAAADVRQLLLNAAAHDLGVAATDLRTDDGHVVTRDGERFAYGRFIATAATLELPSKTRLKPRAQWKYIGRPFARLDGVAKATGTAQFGIDVDIPDLHRAVVRRAPVAGGTLRSMDATTARAMPGVVHVSAIGSGVVVVARRFWQAKKAAEALDVEWDLPAALAGVDTARIKARLQGRTDRRRRLHDGRAWRSGERIRRRQPRRGGRVLDALSRACADGADERGGPHRARSGGRVVRHPEPCRRARAGGAHPRHPGGAGAHALHLAGRRLRPARGARPRRGGGRGGGGQRQAGAGRLDARGRHPPGSLPAGVVDAHQSRGRGRRHAHGLDATRVGANITPDMVGVALPGVLPGAAGQPCRCRRRYRGQGHTGLDRGGQQRGGLHGDYDVANRSVRHVTRDHGLPVLIWRSVGHSYTAFAKESAIDALAQASGLDPVDLRLRNTRDNPRLAEVVRIAGERMQAMRGAPGRGLGLAAHGSFESYVAQVAEVSVVDGAIRVHKVLCVIDCGLAVNPDVVRAQMEGSVVYGLSAALHGNLEVENGRHPREQLPRTIPSCACTRRRTWR